jgi:protein-tyrosine phosphatase
VIDIHCHILPGLDDGPRTEADSLELARAAVAAGTGAIVATPHIRGDYPFQHERIAELADRLRGLLREEGIDLDLLTGGEVALSELDLIDDAHMHDLALGAGDYVLVESPYGEATEMMEGMLFELRGRGFHGDLERLERLVRAGVLTSVTAGSMEGSFGKRVKRFTAELFRAGLVHDVASDAHSAHKRPPGLAAGFEAMGSDLRGLPEQLHWYTREAPAALITGRPLPPRPPEPTPRSIFRRR